MGETLYFRPEWHVLYVCPLEARARLAGPAVGQLAQRGSGNDHEASLTGPVLQGSLARPLHLFHDGNTIPSLSLVRPT